MRRIFILLVIFSVAAVSFGKVDLVTLPKRDTVQLTIYNSADLTLARESRSLTLDQGANKLQFSWENTLIDPTSLEMLPKADADKINIADLVYPPRVNNLGLWNISSEIKGKVPVEISYLTSGLSWRAFYMGTLTPDEKTMRLQGYVRVTNNSGEDYENAQVRLIVGQVHILDQIAELARRQWPYGRPGEVWTTPVSSRDAGRERLGLMRKFAVTQVAGKSMKEIRKEGLSEYFLYTIEGTETIPTGWSKRMISFEADEVPVVNMYKFEEERYGNSVVRFLSFKNDKAHKLGETPIPGGLLKVYRTADDQGHLSYAGQSEFKYIPVEEEVELNLGAVADVVVESKLMDFVTENYEFENPGRDISGWDEVRTYTIEVRNTRDIPVEVEIKRNFPTQYRDVEKKGDFDEFEDVDLDTVKFVLKLEQQSVKKFEYTVRTYHGTREEDWKGGATEPVKSSLDRYPAGADEYFNGIIGEVAICNKALSTEQIRQLYQNDLRGF